MLVVLYYGIPHTEQLLSLAARSAISVNTGSLGLSPPRFNQQHCELYAQVAKLHVDENHVVALTKLMLAYTFIFNRSLVANTSC